MNLIGIYWYFLFINKFFKLFSLNITLYLSFILEIIVRIFNIIKRKYIILNYINIID